MLKHKYKKNLILHFGYPKAASTYIIESIIKISKDANCINVNNHGNLLECFEKILNFNSEKFNKDLNNIKNILNKYLTNDINFFGYERALDITRNPNLKIIFLKRLKKILRDLRINLKLIIFKRDKLEMIESYYKEIYFRIVLKNIENYLFKNYINSILKGKERNLIENLDFNSNIVKIYKLINKRELFIGDINTLKNDKIKVFKSLINFCKIKKFDMDKLPSQHLNESNNKRFFSLIKLRIRDYLFLKKKFNLLTIFNTIEIFLRLIFFQNYLNRSVKIDTKLKIKLLKVLERKIN